MTKPNKADTQRYRTIILTYLSGEMPVGWRSFTSKLRTMDAIYSINEGVVLKSPRLILEENTPACLCVPTFSIHDGWVIQPLVKKTRLKEAVDTLRRKLKKYPKIFPDLHTQNVGWYKGKPLMFDW